MPALKPKKSLALDIDDKRGNSGGFKPSIRPSLGSKPITKLETLVDDEEVFVPPSKKMNSHSNKGDDPNNFANENVMAKSNLRQPKSFNFGFGSDEGSDEEEKVEVMEKFEEEEQEEMPI